VQPGRSEEVWNTRPGDTWCLLLPAFCDSAGGIGGTGFSLCVLLQFYVLPGTSCGHLRNIGRKKKMRGRTTFRDGRIEGPVNQFLFVSRRAGMRDMLLREALPPILIQIF